MPPLRALAAAVLAAGTLTVGAGVAAAETSHRVESGDTLTALAQRYGTTVRELVRLNGLTNPDRILDGRVLVVPSAATVTAPAPGDRHEVAAGETLTAIAGRYGLALDDLQRWNGLHGGVVYAGTSLVLFDPGPAPPEQVLCPVPGAAFSNEWGFPRPGGGHHVAVQLHAEMGTPVRAPVAGTVTHATGATGLRYVWVTGTDGNHWMLGHLATFDAVGEVAAGEVVGTIGAGVGSRPNVRVEFHPAGHHPVNPYPTLRASC